MKRRELIRHFDEKRMRTFPLAAEIILGGTILRKTDVRLCRVYNEVTDQLANKICKYLGVPKVK